MIESIVCVLFMGIGVSLMVLGLIRLCIVIRSMR